MGSETLLAIGLIASAAATAGSVAYQASQGTPSLPDVKAPLPPPAPPPVPQPVPPPAIESQAGEGVARERRRRAQRFGIAQTLLASPLGGGADLQVGGTTRGRSLLGGG